MNLFAFKNTDMVFLGWKMPATWFQSFNPVVILIFAPLFAAAWRMRPESVVLHTGAIVFNGAFVTLMPCFYLGARYVLQRQFDATEAIEIIARERVTHTMMVPAQIIAVLNAPNF